MAHNHHLFEVLDSICDFVAGETDMEEIKRAIMLDDQEEKSTESILPEDVLITELLLNGLEQRLNENYAWVSGFLELELYPMVALSEDDIYGPQLNAFFQKHGAYGNIIFLEMDSEARLLLEISRKFDTVDRPSQYADLVAVYDFLGGFFNDADF
jgi:hypothetical protein